MAGSMVGGTGEVSELVRAWSHVRQGSGSPPSTVIIAGAAGLGKSPLGKSPAGKSPLAAAVWAPHNRSVMAA